MTIQSVTLVWTGDTFDDDLDGPRGYKSLYRVISDDPFESVQAVRAVVPQRGTPYPSDPQAYAKKRSGSRASDTRLVWEVTVDYEFNKDEPTSTPLEDPVKYRWSSGIYTKAVIKDIDGEAIINSAGDYFDPPPEIEDVRWTVNIQANLSVVPVDILDYAGAINSGSYTVDGVPVEAGKSRIIGLDIGDVQERDDIRFRTVTIVIEFRKDGFKLEELDQGYRKKNDEDPPELVDILIEDEDGNRNRPSAPVLLDGEGEILENPTPETAVYMEFDVYPELDFTILPGIVP